MAIHISILRAMADAGASIEIILSAIEADQILTEMQRQERREKRAARRALNNGNANTVHSNGNGRTFGEAARELYDYVARSPALRN